MNNNKDHQAIWWGQFSLAENQTARWTVGPLTLSILRLSQEWRISQERQDDPELAGKRWTVSRDSTQVKVLCCFLIVGLAAGGEVALQGASGRASSKLILRNLRCRGRSHVFSSCLLSREDRAPQKSQDDCRNHACCCTTPKSSYCSSTKNTLLCCCFH